MNPSPQTKNQAYEAATREIHAVLSDESDLTAQMATIAGILHHRLPHFFWTGFYRHAAPRTLVIGPYQGTLGCLRIRFDQGVCGACASTEQTVIVPDTHAFPGHIACDPNSQSEIVVPVFDTHHRLIAVFDVDSTQPAAFDAVDQLYLEQIMTRFANPQSIA